MPRSSRNLGCSLSCAELECYMKPSFNSAFRRCHSVDMNKLHNFVAVLMKMNNCKFTQEFKTFEFYAKSQWLAWSASLVAEALGGRRQRRRKQTLRVSLSLSLFSRDVASQAPTYIDIHTVHYVPTVIASLLSCPISIYILISFKTITSNASTISLNQRIVGKL